MLRKNIVNYPVKAHEIWKEEEGFKPILILKDERNVTFSIDKCERLAAQANQLQTVWKAYFKGSFDLQEVESLFRLEEEKLKRALERKYIQDRNIKIEGLDVKIDKLAELINIPSYEKLLSKIITVKELLLQISGNYDGYNLEKPIPGAKLKTFYHEGKFEVPDSIKARIEENWSVYTQDMKQNYLYLAARKILEGLADLAQLGFAPSGSTPIGRQFDDLLRSLFTYDKDIDINPGILRNFRLR